jgi:hypothetical protein
MNMKWVIIGTIFIVLLVAFGRNPVQEAREQRRKEIDEKGVLVYEIEKHLEDQQNVIGARQGLGSGMNRQLGGSRLQNTLPQQPEPDAGMDTPITPDNPVPQNQPHQGYYPPPPKPESNIPIYDPAVAKKGLGGRTSLELKRLTDNVRLEYRGTRVFSQAQDGSLVPLPDGRYLFFKDRYLMEVEGGERVRVLAYTGQ